MNRLLIIIEDGTIQDIYLEDGARFILEHIEIIVRNKDIEDSPWEEVPDTVSPEDMQELIDE